MACHVQQAIKIRIYQQHLHLRLQQQQQRRRLQQLLKKHMMHLDFVFIVKCIHLTKYAGKSQ